MLLKIKIQPIHPTKKFSIIIEIIHHKSIK